MQTWSLRAHTPSKNPRPVS